MEHLVPWFTLKSVPGIGNHIFKRLMERFKTPSRVFESAMDELLSIQGIKQTTAQLIKKQKIPDKALETIEKALEKGYKIVTFRDPEYPPLLREIPDPPPFFYSSGDLKPSISTIAIVGSRSATSYGLSITKRLSSQLAKRGITIISGMAKGIDSAAHWGAISVKGKTIAVLGSGLNRIYPRENHTLFKRISENGAVISEFPPDTEPDPKNFPIRNRIISGISLGTVVVEATKKSGSLITAGLAIEQNREVFAIPGNINSMKSAGCHFLIKHGAKLVEKFQDIIEELSHLINVDVKDKESKPSGKDNSRVQIAIHELPIYQALSDYPIHIDDLSRRLDMDTAKLSGILLELELKGAVRQAPGKLFSIC